jgi:type II secretion system protein N
VKERILGYAKKYVKYLKYGGYVGYPAFYLVCLLVFFSLTFPYDKLKERVLGAFNADQRTTGGMQELQIDEMSGYWVTGIRMRGVRLLTMPTEPGKPLSRLEIDEATVRYQMLPALVGSSDMSFHLYAFGGDASGSYSVHGTERSVDATLDAIDIGSVDPLVQVLGVPLRGRLSGTIKLEMPEGKAAKGSGAVSLEAKDVVIGDGKAKIKGALALPQIDVGVVTLSGEAKEGVLKFTKLAAGGKDLELQGTESLSDAQVRFKVNDAYRSKSDMTKSLFGAPGSSMPALFEMDAKVKQSKRADGFYVWSIRGPLARPDFLPAGGLPPPAGSGFGAQPRTGP